MRGRLLRLVASGLVFATLFALACVLRGDSAGRSDGQVARPTTARQLCDWRRPATRFGSGPTAAISSTAGGGRS